MPLLETIEQRATACGVVVDSRVQDGRTYRHALERLLEHEQFDRVIVSATESLRTGLSGPDLLWLLTHTDAEVMILKPGSRDTRILSPADLNGKSGDDLNGKLVAAAVRLDSSSSRASGSARR
jgi:hypothetical protein